MNCVYNVQKRARADNDLSTSREFESSRRIKIGKISEHHVQTPVLWGFVNSLISARNIGCRSIRLIRYLFLRIEERLLNDNSMTDTPLCYYFKLGA